jgi:hypothetical protein
MQSDSEHKRKKFLKKFAALSSAAVLAGTNIGFGVGCNNEVEYGPPPVDTTTTHTQPDNPVVEYGPPPIDSNG